MLTYCRTRNRLLGLLGTQFLHGLVVFFLLLGHEDVFVSKVQMKHTSTIMVRHKFFFKKGNQFSDTYLFLLLVEIINDDTDEKVECEE